VHSVFLVCLCLWQLIFFFSNNIASTNFQCYSLDFFLSERVLLIVFQCYSLDFFYLKEFY
jgi:hypothetical protein